jgi:AcrR family transcriptional regulator
VGRPARFTEAGILDAALSAAASRGRQTTVDDVASLLGAHVGSIYYRYPSRESLFGALWVRSVRRFQAVFLAALAHPDARTGLVDSAATIPDYCRTHPDEAVALTLYRHRALLADCPQELYEDVAGLNLELFGILARSAEALGGTDDDLPIIVAATQQVPYGLVRPYLGTPEGIPDWATPAVRAAATAILDLIPRQGGQAATAGS